MLTNAPSLAENGHDNEDNLRKLEEILENKSIHTVFQPIVSLENGTILGYEALSRGPKEMESPETLFAAAKKCNKLWELEYLCRLKALENSKKLELHGCIFLNISPDIINNPKLRSGMTIEALAQYNIDPSNVIIEITEKSAVQDYDDYEKTIDHYKTQGYYIAIDDAGSGYSGLKLISDVRPHYVKMDMSIIRNVDKDKFKLHLIKSFKDFCGATDIKLIAEGIETQEELETLIEIGVNYGQGYFIQRPSNLPTPINAAVVKTITDMQEKTQPLYWQRPSNLPVSHITRKMNPVTPDTACSVVSDLFAEFPFIAAIPIVEGDSVEGIVTRDKFYAKLGSQYGYALFYKRSIDRIMGSKPLTADHQTPIDVVSKMAMTREPGDIYDSIIVTRDGNYFGIVTVKDLLEKYTEMEINHARNQNPLTGLPGNASIENKIEDSLKTLCGFAVIYVDIDNFKPYNDVYGFASGDKIIQFLANILSATVTQECSDQAFVGHIGGDDFVVITTVCSRTCLEDLCKKILEKYRAGINAFYTPEDIKNGGITTKNRHGVEERYGISTLSIACVVISPSSTNTILEISERATRLKKKCKALLGNTYCIE